jgi:flagellar hook-length control protein FliK
MDCTKKNGDTGTCAGFSSDDNTPVNFTELYAAVSKCNQKALVGEENSESQETENCVSEDGLICGENVDSLLQVLGISMEGVESKDSETKVIASDLVRESLQKITAMLGLPDRGLEALDLTNINESTIDQFAEIVHVLNEIASALETPGNEALISQLNMGDGSLAKDEMSMQNKDTQSELASSLRVELFKFQMGMQILGISGEVQSKAAEKAEQVSLMGMNQAVDPSSISMSVEQIKKLFGKALENIDQNSVGKGVSEANVIQVSSDSDNTDQLNVTNVDTKTYRTLLKVDTNDNGSKNVNADVEGKKNDQLVTIANGNIIANDAAAEVEIPEFSVASDVNQIKMDVSNVHHQEKISTTLRKMGDESAVMEQITGKLTSVIRSGSNEVRIQLRPESLGEVNIRIKMEGDVVFTRIQVESQQVKQIVESNLQTLKDALANQNLSTGLIDVSVGKDSGNNGGFQWDLHKDQQSKHSSDNSSEQEQDLEQNVPVNNSRAMIGKDTGIRYGSNSIEYYA